MERKLYLDSKPLLDTYGFLADLLAVIASVDKEGVWLAANYNNLVGYRPGMPFCLYELSIIQNRECGLNMFYQCPFIDFYKYRRIEVTGNQVIDFMREYINCGYYILVNVDRQYLSFYHMSLCSNHEIMVYGFNDTIKEFILCDNSADGKYRTDIRCGYEEMKKGYEKYIVDNDKLDLHDSIVLLKPTADRYGYVFSIETFILHIREYLNYVPIFGGREHNEYWVYGFENYSYLTEYVKKIIASQGKELKKDIRCFCALYDHKKSLRYTFDYFSKKGMLIGNEIVAKYNKIENIALLIRNLMLKLQIKYQEKDAYLLLQYMIQLQEMERSTLEKFLQGC